MGRKAIVSGGKRDEIIAVAQKMFFEKGFDGVTIRTLQKAVGCEVGLFYYYFKSKEEVFDVVIERMEASWHKAIEKVMENLEDDPKACLNEVFEVLSRCAAEFRRMGSDKLHWSVAGGVYERIIGASEGYVEKILEAMGVSGASLKEQAVIISGGLGRLAIAEKGNGYKERIDYVLSAAGIRDYSHTRRREISVELL